MTKPKRASLRKSINDFCKYCIYDPGEPGSWLQQVRECTAKDCPLFRVRPGRYTKKVVED